MRFIFFIFLFYSFTVGAQENVQTIKGRVMDAELETPIPGANVVLLNSDPLRGVVTDQQGFFRMERVPLGRQSVQVSLIGYETKTISNIMVTAGKETDLQIKMVESVTEIEEVVVRSEGEKGETVNQMAIVSARSFSVEETKRYAGSFDDPARMAQSYAGVSNSNDNSNEIVIRGNSPRGVLWKMEGIEIPNPNHFASQGASGGAISMLSSNMMTNSDFFTGAFPSEYGNALSGVFDIHLRRGNADKREYAFQLGVLGSDVAIEGPFKKGYNGSYLVNYRYSTLAMLSLLGLNIAGDVVPVFQDLSFHLVMPTKKAGNFSLFGLAGKSSAYSEWEGEGEKYNDDYRTNMGIAGLTHTYFLNQNSYVKSILSLSGSENSYRMSTYDSSDMFLYDNYRENFQNKALRGTVSYHNKINASHVIRTGVIYSQLGFDFLSRFYREDLGEFSTSVDQNGNSGYAQGYFTWKYRINEKTTLQSGLHYLYFLLNRQQSLEPRLGLKYEISPRHALSFGLGLHSRLEDLTVYMAQTEFAPQQFHRPNEKLGFTKAFHSVLGYDFSATENLRIRPEIYYQYLFNVPIVDRPDSYFSGLNFTDGFTTDTLTNNGSGVNYGIELTIERYFNNSWFCMYTGSLYRSNFIAGDNIIRSTRFDGNYASTLVGGKEFVLRKKNILSFSGRINHSGGRRYIPLLLDQSIAAGQSVYDDSRAFKDRLEDYFRIDLQLSYKINKKSTTHTLKLDIQNLFNRQNIYGQYYDNNTQSIRTVYQMGIIPIVSYKLEF